LRQNKTLNRSRNNVARSLRSSTSTPGPVSSIVLLLNELKRTRGADDCVTNGDSQMAHEDFDDALDHYHHANGLTRSGNYTDAIWHYNRVLDRDWGQLDCEVFVFASWILATCPDASLRNPTRAIKLATEACNITDWCEYWPISTLAAAHAANDEFPLAIEYQNKVVALVASDEYVDDADRSKHHDRLVLYTSGRMVSNDLEP